MFTAYKTIFRHSLTHILNQVYELIRVTTFLNHNYTKQVSITMLFLHFIFVENFYDMTKYNVLARTFVQLLQNV